MEQTIPLSPHEFRVIKLDHHTVLRMLRKILIKFSTERLRSFGDDACTEPVSVGQYYDENKSEMLFFAYIRKENLTEDSIISHIQNLEIVAQDSILAGSDSWQPFISIQIPSKGYSQTQRKEENVQVESNASNNLIPCQKQEVRIIRLSHGALGELLWEYFMEVGYQLMSLSQEDSYDSPTIFRMHTDDQFQSLTLYVMNLFEASNSIFTKIDEYCESNIDALGETVLDNWTDVPYYVSAFISNL